MMMITLKGVHGGRLIGSLMLLVALCASAQAGTSRDASPAERALRCEAAVMPHRSGLLRQMIVCRHRYDLGTSADLDECVSPALARYEAAVAKLSCESSEPEGDAAAQEQEPGHTMVYGRLQCRRSCAAIGLSRGFARKACG